MKSNRYLALLLLFLVLVAGIITANIFSFRNIEQLTTQQIIDTKIVETKFAASQIESHINKVRDELISLSKFPLPEQQAEAGCDSQSALMRGEQETKLEVVLQADKNGKIIACSSEEFQDYLSLNIKDKDYFKIPRQTQEPFITGVIRQGSSRQIIVAVPLFESASYTPYPNFVGKFNGILFSIIEVNELYYLYLLPVIPLVNGEESSFIVLDAETGDYILQGENIALYGNISESIPMQGDKPNTVKYLEKVGPTIVTSSDLIFGKEHWKLVILTPLENTEKEIRALQKQYLITLSIVVLTILSISLFSVWVYRSKEKTQQQLSKATSTLGKLGITAALEGTAYTTADVTLEPGAVYLIKDHDDNALDLFVSALNKGFAGLGIVRDDPRKIKKKYHLEKTPFIWLTGNKIEGVPCEKEVQVLFSLIREFMTKSEKSVVLLEGVDYLILENDLEQVTKIIHNFQDLVSGQQKMVIITVNPNLLGPEKMKVIEALTQDVYGRDEGIQLSPQEKELLRFINEKNMDNTLISYQNITDHLDITKPTTRVRIGRLQQLGLVQVEPRGRFKSLKITSKGRKLM